MAVQTNEPERRMSNAMLSSAASNSDAETQHLDDENETRCSITECDWNYKDERDDLIESYIRSQLPERSQDVVDGGGNVEQEAQVQVPGSSTFFIQPNTELQTDTNASNVHSTKLPTETRVQRWVNDCAVGTACTAYEYTSQVPPHILQNCGYFLSLCKEKLPKWTSQTNMPDIIADESCGLETILTLLKDGNVPEAMMLIIHILCSPRTDPEVTADVLNPAPTVNAAQALMLKTLSYAVQSDVEILSKDELDTTKIEKLMSEMHDIFNRDSEYFAEFSMELLRPKVKNNVILVTLEDYVNRSIKLALECRKAVFDIDYANMQKIVVDNNNSLSTEQQCNLAKKVYAFVRKSIYIRCHNFLARKGFDFGAVDTSQEIPSSMESSNPGDLRSQELSANFGSQPEPLEIIEEIPPNQNYEFVPVPDNNVEFGPELAVAEALFGFADRIFYEDNSQAIPLGNEMEVGRNDNSEDGYLSSCSPSYSLSLPRMSKSPIGSSEGEQSQNQLLSFAEYEDMNEDPRLSQTLSSSSDSDGAETEDVPNPRQRDASFSSSDSEGENGFHSDAKRNRLDFHQN